MYFAAAYKCRLFGTTSSRVEQFDFFTLPVAASTLALVQPWTQSFRTSDRRATRSTKHRFFLWNLQAINWTRNLSTLLPRTPAHFNRHSLHLGVRSPLA